MKFLKTIKRLAAKLKHYPLPVVSVFSDRMYLTGAWYVSECGDLYLECRHYRHGKAECSFYESRHIHEVIQCQ